MKDQRDIEVTIFASSIASETTKVINDNKWCIIEHLMKMDKANLVCEKCGYSFAFKKLEQ